MKLAKIQELRSMSDEDLLALTGQLERDIFNVHEQKAQGVPVTDRTAVRSMRRQRARAFTLLTERAKQRTEK